MEACPPKNSMTYTNMTTTKTMSNTIKLSKQSVDILRNFNSINSNLHIVPGKEQVTVSPQKNIMAEVTMLEDFPVEFAIWDLSTFLGTLSLFEDPDLTFNEKNVVITSGSRQVIYYYAEPKLVKGCRPDRDFEMPSTVIHFDMSNKEFQEIQRAASVLHLPDLCISDHDGGVAIRATDRQTESSNEYTLTVAENGPEGATFNMFLKSEYLRLLPGDYSVGISDKIVAEFKNQNTDLVYYIALDSNSVYNANG